MKTYNIVYKIGSLGCITIDVEMDIDRSHPDFYKQLRMKADEIVENEVKNYGDVDFIYTED